MVFDDLRPGESISTIDSNRPNPNLEIYRNGQLRAIAAPMRISFSTLSKNYNGTYSAQRQELVENFGAYGVLEIGRASGRERVGQYVWFWGVAVSVKKKNIE